MCVDPVTAMAIGSTVLSAGSSWAQAEAQTAAANAQAEATNRQVEQVRKNAQIDFENQVVQRNIAEAQEDEDVAQKSFYNMVETERAAASARAAAGEAGVSGLSVDALIADFYGQGATAASNLDRASTLNTAQRTINLDAAAAELNARSNSIQPQNYTKTDYLGLALGVGANAINTADRFKLIGKS